MKNATTAADVLANSQERNRTEIEIQGPTALPLRPDLTGNLQTALAMADTEQIRLLADHLTRPELVELVAALAWDCLMARSDAEKLERALVAACKSTKDVLKTTRIEGRKVLALAREALEDLEGDRDGTGGD